MSTPQQHTQPNQSLALPVGTQNTLRDLLNKNAAALAEVLPKHMDADRLVKVALLASMQNPRLLQCSKQSILQSLMTAAQLGLEVNGVLGSGYLVPYGNVAQFIPGYRGMIDLARRAGAIKKAQARIVYEDDDFSVDYGSETLVHKPNLRSAKRSPEDIIAVYFIATLPDGDRQFEVMTKDEIDAIRKRSKAASNGPWVTDFAEMAKKTVVKRAVKYLPLSPELEAAIELDNRIESGQIGGVSDVIDTEASIIERVATQTAEKTEALKQELVSAENQSNGNNAAVAQQSRNDSTETSTESNDLLPLETDQPLVINGVKFPVNLRCASLEDKATLDQYTLIKDECDRIGVSVAAELKDVLKVDFDDLNKEAAFLFVEYLRGRKSKGEK